MEEYCEEQRQLAEASKEGLGSEWVVVPMMMMVMMCKCVLSCDACSQL